MSKEKLQEARGRLGKLREEENKLNEKMREVCKEIQEISESMGTMTCGRRAEFNPDEGPDHWHEHENGDKVCSYCGSMEWTQFLKICEDIVAGNETDAEIEWSTKGYKCYVRRSGVLNASEGAIKFYTQHIPKEFWDENGRLCKEKANLFTKARRISWKKFQDRMNDKG